MVGVLLPEAFIGRLRGLTCVILLATFLAYFYVILT